MLRVRKEADNGLANTDEGTTSAPTGVNSTEELLDPVCKFCFFYHPWMMALLI
jgi:hypothetical protein